MTAKTSLSQRTLPIDPTAPTQTATKSYVDNTVTPLASAAPAAIGTTNTVGTSVTAARADHVHAERQATLDRITRLERAVFAPVTLTDATTIATDASLGCLFRVTMLGNRTLGVPSNPTDGQICTWEVTASGAARTLTLSTATGGFDFGTDITALTATTSGLTDYIRAIYNATANRWRVLAYAKGF